MPHLSVRAYLAALPAAVLQREKDEAYKVYVTDTLRIIGENTAKYAGGGYIKARYAEIINPKPEEKRTGSEIIHHMKKKIAQTAP